MSLQKQLNEEQTVSYAWHTERLKQVVKDTRAIAAAEFEASLRSFEAGEVSIKVFDEAGLNSKRYVATWAFLGEKHMADVFIDNSVVAVDSEAEIMLRVQSLLSKQLASRLQAMMFRPTPKRAVTA